MAAGSGTARMLGISTDTVIHELKKKDATLKPVNPLVLEAIKAPE